jgi:hypothetical protein
LDDFLGGDVDELNAVVPAVGEDGVGAVQRVDAHYLLIVQAGDLVDGAAAAEVPKPKSAVKMT